MLDILSGIYHDDPLAFKTLCCLEDPMTPEEHHVANQLRAVDEKIAEKLIHGICVLADAQAEQSFYTGMRVGAQLMAQLMAQ